MNTRMATYGQLESSPYHAYVQRRRKTRTCCGFSTPFIIWIIQVFNFIFCFSGVFLLLLTFFYGWSSLLTNDHFEIPTIRELLPNTHSLNLLHYTMITCGASIILVSVINIIYQCRRSKKQKPKRPTPDIQDIDELTLTMTSRFHHRKVAEKRQSPYSSLAICAFIFALLFLFTFQLAIGFMSFLSTFSEAPDESSMKDQFFKSVQSNLNSSNITEILDAKSKELDVLQEVYKCCGLNSFKDYVNKVPDTCCKTISFNCSRSKHPSNVHHRGCVKLIANVTYEHIIRIGSFALGLSFIPLFGLLFSCCLYIQLVRNKNDY